MFQPYTKEELFAAYEKACEKLKIEREWKMGILKDKNRYSEKELIGHEKGIMEGEEQIKKRMLYLIENWV